MPRSNLPFGSQSSPVQIDLPVLLELAHQHGPAWKAFEQAVHDRYLANRNISDDNKAKLANNTKLSMRAYDLVGEEDTTLTEVGEALHHLRHEEARLSEGFG